MAAPHPIMHTVRGVPVSLLDPSPRDILVEDVARALSHQCRYVGQTRHHYSVAEHSVRVSTACAPQDALWGLLHDAAEAYVGDAALPVKRHLGEAWEALEGKVQDAVCLAFGLAAEQPPSVSAADKRLAHTEIRDLMLAPWPASATVNLGAPLAYRIVPWSAEVAEEEFLLRFYALTDGALPRPAPRADEVVEQMVARMRGARGER